MTMDRCIREEGADMISRNDMEHMQSCLARNETVMDVKNQLIAGGFRIDGDDETFRAYDDDNTVVYIALCKGAEYGNTWIVSYNQKYFGE